MRMYATLSDAELTTLLKEGNAAAFTEIYNRYWRTLYGLSYNRLRDLQSAEDVVHDVLVSLWKNRETAVVENMTAYLATATKYKIFHLLKRTMKFSVDEHDQEKAENILDTEDMEDRLHYRRLLELVNEEVEKLPEKCRLIFKYSREENLSVKEIAEKMDISTSTVENQMNKALTRLRAKVKNLHLVLF